MKKQNLLNVISSILVFGILNMPSIKIFKSSELINIALLAGIWFFGVLKVIKIENSRVSISKSQLNFLLIFVCMWMVMFCITLFMAPSEIALEDIIQFMAVILIVIGIVLFTRKEELKNVITLQILWSTFLAFMNLTGKIVLKKELGQHYLTLGMPIGIGIVCGLGLILYTDLKKQRKILLLICLLICVFSITKLKGRGPLILSILIPLITMILSLLFEKNIMYKIKKGFKFFIVFVLFFLIMLNNISSEWISRFERLNNIEDERRYYVYKKSIDIILNNPFGIGLQGGIDYGIQYPHNILLEVGMYGGIISIIILLLLLLMVARQGIKLIKEKSIATIVFSIFLFYFSTWNISYNLSSSYIPFTSMAILFIMSSKFDENIEEINNNRFIIKKGVTENEFNITTWGVSS